MSIKGAEQQTKSKYVDEAGRRNPCEKHIHVQMVMKTEDIRFVRLQTC